MANKKNKTNFLGYILIGLVAVCVILLVSQIVTNASNELRVNQSNEGYSVVAEFDPYGQVIDVTPTPQPTRDPSLPTPTYDITEGE